MKCCEQEQTTPYCAWCGLELERPAMESGAGNGLGRVYGYARASRSHQIASPAIQEDLIREKAETIDGAEFVHCRIDAASSATKIRWNDPLRRPSFRKLMRELRSGDHLVIWRLDRLERSMFGMIDCLRWLVERGVSVHILEHGGMQLDLDKPTGRLLVMVLAGFAGFFSAQLSEAIKAARAYRIAHGLAVDSHPALGKCRKSVVRGGQTVKLETWDPHQCNLLREIKFRFDHGERMLEIIADFYERKEKDARGRPWAAYEKKCRKGRLKPIFLKNRFYYAYWNYTALLAEGKDLQDLVPHRRTREMAQRQLARRGKRYGEAGRFGATERENLEGTIPVRLDHRWQKAIRRRKQRAAQT